MKPLCAQGPNYMQNGEASKALALRFSQIARSLVDKERQLRNAVPVEAPLV